MRDMLFIYTEEQVNAARKERERLYILPLDEFMKELGAVVINNTESEVK